MTRPEVGVLPRVVPVSTVPPRPVLSHDEGGAEVSILGELGGNPQAVGSRVTEAVVCHATSRCAQPCVECGVSLSNFCIDMEKSILGARRGF